MALYIEGDRNRKEEAKGEREHGEKRGDEGGMATEILKGRKQQRQSVSRAKQIRNTKRQGDISL
jgi:hypothetical protein